MFTWLPESEEERREAARKAAELDEGRKRERLAQWRLVSSRALAAAATAQADAVASEEHRLAEWDRKMQEYACRAPKDGAANEAWEAWATPLHSHRRLADGRPAIAAEIQRTSIEQEELAASPHTRSTRLELSRQRLTTVHDDIRQLGPHLTELSLASNAIEVLPHAIGALSRLTTLIVSHNVLTRLPGHALEQLTALQHLDASSNLLRELPESISTLPQLTTLQVRHNRLACLPTHLGGLPSLTRLDAGHNELRNLPKSLGSLVALIELDVTQNDLTRLIPVAQLMSLTRLDVSHNHLTALPPALSRLPDLTVLCVSGNPLPEETALASQLAPLTTPRPRPRPTGDGHTHTTIDCLRMTDTPLRRDGPFEVALASDRAAKLAHRAELRAQALEARQRAHEQMYERAAKKAAPSVERARYAGGIIDRLNEETKHMDYLKHCTQQRAEKLWGATLQPLHIRSRLRAMGIPSGFTG